MLMVPAATIVTGDFHIVGGTTVTADFDTDTVTGTAHSYYSSLTVFDALQRSGTPIDGSLDINGTIAGPSSVAMTNTGTDLTLSATRDLTTPTGGTIDIGGALREN